MHARLSGIPTVVALWFVSTPVVTNAKLKERTKEDKNFINKLKFVTLTIL